MSAHDRPRSVLDDLGEEITGIMLPVSICMALVVVLVKALNPDGQADTTTVAIATIAYHEKARLASLFTPALPYPSGGQASAG